MPEIIGLEEAGVVVLHDDDDTRRRLADLIPRGPGLRLLAAGSTAQAFEILAARSPEIVVLGVCPASAPPIAVMSPRCMLVTTGPTVVRAAFAHLDEIGDDVAAELVALLRSFRRALTGETVLRPRPVGVGRA